MRSKSPQFDMKLNMKEMQSIVNEMLNQTIEICEKNSILYYAQAGTVLGAVRHDGPIPWDHDADIIIPNNEIDRFVSCMQRDLPEKYYIDYYTVFSKNLRQFPRVGLKGYSSKNLHLDIFRLIGLPDSREEQIKMIKEARMYTKNNSAIRNEWWKTIIKGEGKYLIYKFGFEKYPETYFVEKFSDLCSRYPYETATYVMNPSGKYGEKNIFKKEVYGQGKNHKYDSFSIRIPSETDFYLKQYYGNYMEYPPSDYIEKEMNQIFDIK